MKVEILGTGCAKCRKLAERAGQAVEELGVEAEVAKVEDIQEIMTYGILITPGLAIDGKVVSAGKLLSIDEIKKQIRKCEGMGDE